MQEISQALAFPFFHYSMRARKRTSLGSGEKDEHTAFSRRVGRLRHLIPKYKVHVLEINRRKTHCFATKCIDSHREIGNRLVSHPVLCPQHQILPDDTLQLLSISSCNKIKNKPSWKLLKIGQQRKHKIDVPKKQMDKIKYEFHTSCFNQDD